jgi:hypothetical protein
LIGTNLSYGMESKVEVAKEIISLLNGFTFAEAKECLTLLLDKIECEAIIISKTQTTHQV